MPSIVGIYNKYKDYITSQTIIRLHGPDRSGIEKISGENWNKIYINRDEKLTVIVKMTKELQSRVVDVYLNVNNHYEGCAPLTIEKIKKLYTDNFRSTHFVQDYFILVSILPLLQIHYHPSSM